MDVFRTSAERQGAYDLLENTAVTGAAIVDSMGRATAEACDALPYVLVSIDGSSLNITDRAKRKGFGIVGNTRKNGCGLKVVSSLAISPDGTPLGLLDQQWWLRAAVKNSSRTCRTRPTAEKETRFFNQAIQECARRLGEHMRGWFLLDRESDRHATLELVLGMPEHWFTIRSNHDRRVLTAKESAGPLHHRRLFRQAGRRRFTSDALRRAKVVGHMALDLKARPGRRKRVAQLAIRVAKQHVWLYQQKGPASAPRMTLVEARETRTAPRGESPIHWRLWTNYPVETREDAELVVAHYAKRWRIEDFHKTWKTGACDVETCQLRSPEAVIKWAAIMAAVAVRVERLKHLSRNAPDSAASVELTPSEISALVFLKRTYKKRTETIPTGMPTIHQATLWLAEIGGYTGSRSSGGPPGSINIRRGLEHIRSAAMVFEHISVRPQMR